MHIGIPTEIKIAERRVGATPAVVGELTANGHEVMVQTRAGDGAGFAMRTFPPGPPHAEGAERRTVGDRGSNAVQTGTSAGNL